jgi:hypothetical protein
MSTHFSSTFSVTPSSLSSFTRSALGEVLENFGTHGFGGKVISKVRILSVEYFGDVKEENGHLQGGKNAGAVVIGELVSLCHP